MLSSTNGYIGSNFGNYYMAKQTTISCYHCGDPCKEAFKVDNKTFCCGGCKQVYLLLNENNLCTYYDIDKNPGIKAKGKFRSDRFAYLDDKDVISKLIQFDSPEYVNVTFSLPQMHCSSCIYLLENLHRIEKGVLASRTSFQRKEVLISYNPKEISLRKVVELLAFIGYEPNITLQEVKDQKIKRNDPDRKSKLFKIGVSGFCFANIMMLSLPDYFADGNITETGLSETFIWLSFFLSLPVLFYGASDIFKQAWAGLRRGDLNIDVPIVLAIFMTFGRSYYEIFTGTGTGFLDSGTGIIFFMIVGRWFQGKTYESLEFDRDYNAYFPLGVTVMRNGKESNIPLTKLKNGEIIILRNDEMIPADSILKEGEALIDYSFVTGENDPIPVKKEQLLYAGGKQTAGRIELQLIKEPSQSYITELWNKLALKGRKSDEESFVHPWSRYFTIVLLSIATLTFVYWFLNDTSKLFPAVTAVLIVACPCSLLLTATFTFGGMVRHFGKHKLYLKNAGVIESMASVHTIVFDKTGTLTEADISAIHYEGEQLNATDKLLVKSAAAQSSHTLSKLIYSSISNEIDDELEIETFAEESGKGVSATIDKHQVKLGSANYVGEMAKIQGKGSRIYVNINNNSKGYFEVGNKYREGFEQLINKLAEDGYQLHLLSGDNDAENYRLKKMFGDKIILNFNVNPSEKLSYIESLQNTGAKVMMVGDGLNDAGALLKSDVGIAINDHSSRFTPACDAILQGNELNKLDSFLKYAKSAKGMIATGFIVSILYNIVGLSFAVQGLLSPLVAAILMPASSITLVSLATLLAGYKAKKEFH